MKALVLNALNHGFDFEDVEIAASIGREFLVDVQASGLCHTDLLFATQDIASTPSILWHEVAEFVADVGPDVAQFRVGDHVVGSLAQSCGGCAKCLRAKSVCRDGGALLTPARYASPSRYKPDSRRHRHGHRYGVKPGNLFDERKGRIMNATLADYHLPVHLDVPAIEVLFTDHSDARAWAGGRGVGEIGIVGVAAPIANAIRHATGVRVRDLPITLDKLLRRSGAALLHQRRSALANLLERHF